MYGISKKKRLAIASELASLGLVKSSREYRRAYGRLYRKESRKNPGVRDKERVNWNLYYHSKLKLSPQWNCRRISNWRKANPEAWKKIMRRASANGLFKRFYVNHRREQIERCKAFARFKNPTVGLKTAISALAKSGDWQTFEREFERAFVSSIEGKSD